MASNKISGLFDEVKTTIKLPAHRLLDAFRKRSGARGGGRNENENENRWEGGRKRGRWIVFPELKWPRRRSLRNTLVITRRP